MKTSLVLIFMLISNSVWADWKFASKNDEGSEFYIDYDTIRKDGHLRKVWEVMNSPSPKSFNGAVYVSVRSRAEYDCKEERKRNLTTTAHTELFAQGENIWTSDSPSDWSYLPPQSAVFSVFQKVCGASVR